MRYVETTGKTVDEAITEALVQLGVPSDQVEVEILEEGSKGVLGIFGAKEAKVRVTSKTASVEDEIFGTGADIKAEAKAKNDKKNKKADKKPADKKPADKNVEKPAEKAADQAVAASAAPELPEGFVMDTLVEDRLRRAKEAKAKEEEKANEPPKDPAEYDADAKIAEAAAKEFLKPVLAKMGIEAELVASREEADVICLDIRGENLGMMIGKRGNTLDSLQYLTSLVANKGTDKHIKVKLDAENYREKRKETLEKLAVNLAKKVRKTNHRVALEPMNPYERRIIHATLQSFNGVDTHSEGEEPFRKVVISPVRSGNRHH